MGDLSENFSRSEFACPCGECGGFPVEPSISLVQILQSIRYRAGRPIRITSGVRCPVHNMAVGGVEASEHTSGEGADLAATSSRERWELVSAALKAGVRRIGIGKTFIHIGVSKTLDTEVIWLYSGR